MQINIEELKEQLKDYYGTAATVMGGGNPFECMPAMADMLNVDDMTDEEVINEAINLGIINPIDFYK